MRWPFCQTGFHYSSFHTARRTSKGINIMSTCSASSVKWSLLHQKTIPKKEVLKRNQLCHSGGTCCIQSHACFFLFINERLRLKYFFIFQEYRRDATISKLDKWTVTSNCLVTAWRVYHVYPAGPVMGVTRNTHHWERSDMPTVTTLWNHLVLHRGREREVREYPRVRTLGRPCCSPPPAMHIHCLPVLLQSGEAKLWTATTSHHSLTHCKLL